MAPQTSRQWRVEGRSGFSSLNFSPSAPIPSPLSDHDTLVQIHYASLNYRDLIITMKGKYFFPTSDPVVPLSDGAGTVLDVGPRVKDFKKGDRVMVTFNQSHEAGDLTTADLETGTGGAVDGTAREFGVFEEGALVKMPNSLSFKEASTLPCAALTAWNALYGLESRAVKAGDWVLTQGTGGVSVFAIQFAKAAGARVIATTSSEAKASKLKALGADHVINYKNNPAWGEEAKSLTTPDGAGVSHVLEVGGPPTMKQSLAAIKHEGVISIIGFLAGVKSEEQPSFLDCLAKICTVRGILVGSRLQFQKMVQAIDAVGVKPVLEEREFGFEELKEAYQYMWDGNHFGKVVVKVSESGGEGEGGAAKL